MNDSELDRIVSGIFWSCGKRRRTLKAELKRLGAEDAASFRAVIEAVIERLARVRFWRLPLTLAGIAVGILAVLFGAVPLILIIIPWVVVLHRKYNFMAGQARSLLSATNDIQVIRLVLWLFYNDDRPGSSIQLRDHIMTTLPRLRREHADLIDPVHRSALREILHSATHVFLPPTPEDVIAVMKGLVQIGDSDSIGVLRQLAQSAKEPAIRHLAEAGILELQAPQPVRETLTSSSAFRKTPLSRTDDHASLGRVARTAMRVLRKRD